MMKSISLFILFVCSAIKLHAQATLTGDNFNPQVGDVFISYYQNSPYPSQGNSGANVIWDFHTLLSENPDTTTYVTCSSTPECDHFPGSTIVDIVDGGYGYMTANSNSLVSNGFFIPGPYGDTSVSNGDTILKYPITYGSSFANNFTGNDHVPDNDIETGTYTETMTCDGYGTLILPNATFQNVLRLREVQTETLVGSEGTFHYVDTIYSWAMPGFHNPLLTIGYDVEQETNSTDTSVSYATAAGNTAVSNINAGEETAFDLYPNPAAGIFNITFSLSQNKPVTIILCDMLGRKIATIANGDYGAGGHNISYNTSGLSKGIYMVSLKSNTQVLTKKLEVK